MGKRTLSTQSTLPCQVTKTLSNAANLTNAALAKAGIVNAPPLFQLPHDIMQERVVPNLDSESLSCFAGSSSYAHELFKPELHHRSIKQLFEHILGGNMAEVKKMLETNPRLALATWQARTEEEKVMMNMGKQRIYVEGKTAYQLALGEEDTEMAALLKAYIVKLAGVQVADAQFLAQFPSRWKEQEEKRWGQASTLLGQLAEAIRNATHRIVDPNIDVGDIELDANIVGADIISSGDPDYKLTLREGSNVANVLADYKQSLEDIRREAVTTGRHFNPNLLQNVFEIYYTHYGDYYVNSGGKNPRAILYWLGGIGSSESLMPANYFQACRSDFYIAAKKLNNGTPQDRLLGFEIFDEDSLSLVGIPVSRVTARLRLDLALGQMAEVSGWDGAGAGVLGTPSDFKELMSSKNRKFGELMPRETPGCLIQ